MHNKKRLENCLFRALLCCFDVISCLSIGNRAKARKIIIFDKDSKITTDRNSPVKFKEAKEVAGRLWMTKIEHRVTVQWPGHFSSSGHRSNSWANPVAEWEPQRGIDDRFGDKYGGRSIARISDYVDGIASYNLVYVIDSQGGRGLTMENGTANNFSGSVRCFDLKLFYLNSSLIILFSDFH